MSDLFETHQSRLLDVFSGEKSYSIPMFQREYAWTDEQVDRFWEDLLAHHDNDEDLEYFFGIVILLSKEEGHWEIVDGQQRFTTSLIFLCVIRDTLLKLNRKEDADMIERFIKPESILGKKQIYQYRLITSMTHKEFFQNEILHPRKSDLKIRNTINTYESNKNLAMAYQTIRKRLDQRILEQYPENNVSGISEFLISLASRFTRFFVIQEFILSNPERVYRIFDSINNRGLDLNQSDIVKNYLLQNIDTKETDVIPWYNKWMTMSSNFGYKIKEEDFLRHYLLAHHDPTGPSEVFERISKILKTNAEKQHIDFSHASQEFIDSLLKQCQVYIKLRNPRKEDWNDAEFENLQHIKNLNFKSIYPPLLIAYYKFENAEKFTLFTNILLRFFFRVKTICNIHASAIETFMNILCTNIREGSYDDIIDLKKELTSWSQYPNDVEFQEQFENFTSSVKNVNFYILKSLNEGLHKLSNTPLKPVNNNNYNIDYILPENISNTIWYDVLKNDVKPDTDVKILHSSIVKRVGNLTLVEKNKSQYAKSESFKNKYLRIYKIQKLEIATHLNNWKIWNVDSIMSRQKKLSNVAKIIWNIND